MYADKFGAGEQCSPLRVGKGGEYFYGFVDKVCGVW
jgi:hypothetical protein